MQWRAGDDDEAGVDGVNVPDLVRNPAVEVSRFVGMQPPDF